MVISIPVFIHMCILCTPFLPCDCRVSVPRISLQSPYKWSKKYRRRTCDLVETMGLSQVSHTLCICVRICICTYVSMYAHCKYVLYVNACIISTLVWFCQNTSLCVVRMCLCVNTYYTHKPTIAIMFIFGRITHVTMFPFNKSSKMYSVYIMHPYICEIWVYMVIFFVLVHLPYAYLYTYI